MSSSSPSGSSVHAVIQSPPSPWPWPSPWPSRLPRARPLVRLHALQNNTALNRHHVLRIFPLLHAYEYAVRCVSELGRKVLLDALLTKRLESGQQMMTIDGCKHHPSPSPLLHDLHFCTEYRSGTLTACVPCVLGVALTLHPASPSFPAERTRHPVAKQTKISTRS